MATKKAPQTSATSGAAAAPALAPVTAAPKKRSAPKKTETVTAAPKAAAAKKATPVVAKPEPVIEFTVLQDEIRTEAYSYFIQREYRAGDPTADWHRAEETVLRRYGLR